MPGDQESAPAVAHLLPLRGQARDIICGASSLLFGMPATPSKAPDVVVLEALFDLTPRGSGGQPAGRSRPVVAIDRQEGVTTNTVRAQLKAVFGKTDAGQQSQLVSLLAMRSSCPAGRKRQAASAGHSRQTRLSVCRSRSAPTATSP